MRCNFVDLYFALYGSKRPQCIQTAGLSAISSLPKIQKISSEPKHRPSSPPVVIAEEASDVKVFDSSSRNEMMKQEPELIIEEEHIVVKEEETVEIAKEDAKSLAEPETAATKPPEAKRLKTEFCSDNSVSLPGLNAGSSGPTGFEPGMFKNEDESSSHSKTKSEKDKSVDGSLKVT